MTDDETALAPVSKARVDGCLRSATFWVGELPKYADRQQRNADAWAIAAGILASLTGLSIFPIATDTSPDSVKVVVSIVAFAAALCALVPRVKNYGELAGQARELTSRYGGVVGDLLDLAKMEALDSDAARPVVEEFEAIKEKKDGLRGLPDRASAEIERINAEVKVLEAQAGLDAAKAKAKALSSGGPTQGTPPR